MLLDRIRFIVIVETGLLGLTYHAWLFYLLAALAIGAGVGTITRKNPVTSAFFLILHFIFLAGLYASLHAHLLAVMQVLVYAGAIMVLVLFVIMLLNLGKEPESQQSEQVVIRKIAGYSFSAVMLVMVGLAALLSMDKGNTMMTTMADNVDTLGTAESIGAEMFTTYLFPFEAVSLLLLAAVAGSILLAKKRLMN